ncbi:protein of unknown function [Desulfonatronum thiosulfatophilum]|uniref:GTP-binding protein n=1 Tax=Desulfonatronum thiosulfatophilum TaxID=617002 RepID=A0A1G6E8Q1_9BACT|nr:DUF4416 family protein [Desulfonatronum thiosulfatophilum]SDB53844.1 protein of unknown function [Desulfonatronum thiosulfatophilum]
MSTPRPPLSAQLVLSLFSSRWEMFWPDLIPSLESFLGRLESAGTPIPFSETTYYEAEFGTPLQRRLLAFEQLVPQERLREIKLWSHDLEQKYLRGGQRLFNLDPGLLTQERFVLATGKNFTHRIYLGDGVFADLTLIYQAGRWQTLPWTFRDYAAPVLQHQLTQLRLKYRAKLGIFDKSPVRTS